MTKPMKYSKIRPDDIGPYLADDRWTLMQKLDGMRLRATVEHRKYTLAGAAKSTAIAEEVAAIRAMLSAYAASDHAAPHSMDGEVIDGTWWLFDVYNDTAEPWEARHPAVAQLAALLDRFAYTLGLGLRIRAVPVMTDTATKTRMWNAVLDNDLEGVILKRVDSIYEPATRVDHVLKCKITDTVDVVVMERGPGNGRNGTGNWIRFGVYRDECTEGCDTGRTELVELGRCSTIGKPVAQPGDVIEVKYLYAGAGGRLVQPTHLRNRPDRDPESCDGSQLRYVNKKVIA